MGLGIIGWALLMAVWFQGDLDASPVNYHILGSLVTFPFWGGMMLGLIFWHDAPYLPMVILITIAASVLLLFNGGIINNSVLAWQIPKSVADHYLPDLSFAGSFIVSAATTIAALVFVCADRREPHKSLLG